MTENKPAHASMQPWHGGKCPVDGNQAIRVVLRSGEKGECLARHVTWAHAGGENDIIAYQIIDGECNKGPWWFR